MGAAASEEVEKWVSLSELVKITRKMHLLPALPPECQVEALRCIWRSLTWVPEGTLLLWPSVPITEMLVIVRGEAEMVMSTRSYMPVMPAGTFVCEGALLRDDVTWRGNLLLAPGSKSRQLAPNAHQGTLQEQRLPGAAAIALLLFERARILRHDVLAIVEEFLRPNGKQWLRFRNKLITTRRSLIGRLTNVQFRRAVDKAQEQISISLNGSRYRRRLNIFQNIMEDDAEEMTRHGLGVNDITALRVVCEGPTHISCTSVTSSPWPKAVSASVLGSCMQPLRAPQVDEEQAEQL